MYNGAVCIEKALASLQNQEWTDYELLISDNASTDTTLQIVERAAAADSRIRLLVQPENIGPWPNFLSVLREARGELFMWAAADDRWDRQFISVLAARHARHPELVLAMARYDRFSHVTTESGTVPAESYPELSVEQSRFENMRHYLRRGAPEMVYGLFKRGWLQSAVQGLDMNFDFSDVALVNAAVLAGPVDLAPEVLFHSGHLTARTLKSMSSYRWPGLRLDYHSYFSATRRLIQNSSLTPKEKAQLQRFLRKQVLCMIAVYEPVPSLLARIWLSCRHRAVKKSPTTRQEA